MATSARYERLKKVLEKEKLDVVVALSPENTLYFAETYILTQASIRDRLEIAVLPLEKEPYMIGCSIEQPTIESETWITDRYFYTEFLENPIEILADVLKKRGLINQYDWSIYFKKGPKNNGSFLYNPDFLINAEGEILIGDLPNNYNPNNYNIEQLKKTYSIYTPQLFKWGLQFHQIYYYKNNNCTNDNIKNESLIEKISLTDVQININNYIILSPMIYFHKIRNDFFDSYIKEGICKINQGIEYKTISCKKSEKFGIENLKQFPTLYMQHQEFNYTFEFTYEDLFLEKDDNFWFLISLSSFKNDLEEWTMGIIFLRKYNLIFNQDTKTISFYNTNIPIEDIDDKKWNRRFMLTIILIGLLFIIGISFIFIYIYMCKRLLKSNKDKKRLNHIYDNSDYLKDDKLDINKKAPYYQQLLVEMKGLVLS